MAPIAALLGQSKKALSRPLGLLDIGTSKILCMIVAAGDLGVMQVLGIGHQRSRGIKAGVVVDLDEAELAVRAAVAQAERMANVELDALTISVACGRLKSLNFVANAEVAGRVVRDEDVDRVLQGGRHYAERDGRTLVHLNQCGHMLDGTNEIDDARGLAGRMLGIELHGVTADDGPLRNLFTLVERCHLTTSKLVVASFASALASTTRDEREHGVIGIDIGGGTTKIAVFVNDRFVFTDTLPVGGNHVTFDIARALATPLGDAERIKTLYASLVAAASDERETISYASTSGYGAGGDGDGDSQAISKAQLRQIVAPRMADTLAMVADRLARADLGIDVTRPVVLTGGAAQMIGLGEFAANALGRPVRISRPEPRAGMPDNVCQPAFSVVAGMAQAIADPTIQLVSHHRRDSLGTGSFGRVGQWLKAGF